MAGQSLTVVDPNKPTPRLAEDVVAMGAVVQANVVQFRNAECKRTCRTASEHDIQVPSPGSIAKCRGALIDWRVIKGYSDAEIHLRLHEVWGQYCLFCWLWGLDDPGRSRVFLAGVSDGEIRCQSAIEVKMVELEGHLWALRFEQRFRHEPGFSDQDEFPGIEKLARMIPVKVFGQSPEASDDDALVLASCELAGMLAVARWSFDTKWAWNQAGIMDVDDAYFENIARQA